MPGTWQVSHTHLLDGQTNMSHHFLGFLDMLLPRGNLRKQKSLDRLLTTALAKRKVTGIFGEENSIPYGKHRTFGQRAGV